MILSYKTKLWLYLFGVKKYIGENNIDAVRYYYNNYHRTYINNVFYCDRNDWVRHIEYTPLIYAIKRENFEIAKILIDEFGADVNVFTIFDDFYADSKTTNALFLAIKISTYYKYRGKFDIYKKCIEFCKYLIHDKNANLLDTVLMYDNDEYNVLQYAAFNNVDDVVEFILKNNKDIEIDSLTKYGKTALFLAVSENNFSVVNVLAENGANINFTYNKCSPLCIAYENKSLAISKYLETLGANIV